MGSELITSYYNLKTFIGQFWWSMEKFVTYSSGEQLFGLPVTDYEVFYTKLGKFRIEQVCINN